MIIVIGASGGIGASLFDKYKTRNEPIIGTYNKNRPATNIENMYQVDVTDYSSIEKWIEQINPKLENIKIVICSGSNYNSFAHKADPNYWANLININLIGSFNVVRGLLPIMREQSFGRIVFISSIVPQIGVAGTSAYSASKSGLWGLSKSLSKENANKGITSNCINSGYIDAGMTYSIPNNLLDDIKKGIPLNRFGTTNEFFNTVEYLFNTPYVTGTSIDINGGLY